MFGYFDLHASRQVSTGGRFLAGDNFIIGPGSDNLTAMHASSGSYVNDVVCRPDGIFVVFDDQYGIAEVAKVVQGLYKALVIALM